MFTRYSGFCWKRAVINSVKYPVLFSTETNMLLEAFMIDYLGWTSWPDAPYSRHFEQLLIVKIVNSNEAYFLYETGVRNKYIKNVYFHITNILREYRV